MNTSDWIGNVVAQLIVAIVAIWAVITSLHANKAQMRSSDKQVKDQIDASNEQLKKQIDASDLQVRRQTEESRPILAPQKEVFGDAVTYFSPESGKANETLYASDGRISWSPIWTPKRAPPFALKATPIACISVRKRVVSRDDGSMNSGRRSVKIFRRQDSVRQKNFLTHKMSLTMRPAQGSSMGCRR